jgi:methyltransferase
LLIAAAVVVFAFMAVEARRAARNERAQRALGGIEPPDDVYRWMQVAYPGAFAAMFVEGVIRHAPPPPALAIAGVAIFTLAKTLKWWAIVTLGRFWTFRVVVVPGATLVDRGPYRMLRHPNYVGVIGELVGVGLLTGAVVSGPVATALFAGLIRRRVTVEERALANGSRVGRSV